MATEITCPRCDGQFELTEALAAPLLQAERAKVEQTVSRRLADERKADAEAREAEVRAALAQQRAEHEQDLARRDRKVAEAQQLEQDARKAKEAADELVREQQLLIDRAIEAERARIMDEAGKAARQQAARELEAAQAQAQRAIVRAEKAEAAEVEAMKLKQAAIDKSREFDVQVQRQVDQALQQARDAARRDADHEHGQKLREKDVQLEAMRKQIEELRRKGVSASQQIVGDAQELNLHELLQAAFPHDRFERIPKGQRGGDVLQTVHSRSGDVAGTILWESKCTKAWQAQWLPKLRNDQREAGADIAVIASETLPADLDGFDLRDGVWITGLRTIVPIALALREGLMDRARAASVAQLADTAKDRVFAYLTSNVFRQRLQQMVEAYDQIRLGLDNEKKWMTRSWAERERNLDRMVGGMHRLYSDLQGASGDAMPPVPLLEPPANPAEGRPKLVAGSDAQAGAAPDDEAS